MGSVVLQAASPGRRWAFPHSWIMIHEPAKWAGWQSTTAAAQHLDRLKQMQDQIYRILADRSGKPLRQIIRDTKRTDFYLDSAHSKRYGLIDEIIGETIRIKDGEAIPIVRAAARHRRRQIPRTRRTPPRATNPPSNRPRRMVRGVRPAPGGA